MKYVSNLTSTPTFLKCVASSATLAVCLASVSLPAQAWSVGTLAEQALSAGLAKHEKARSGHGDTAPVSLPAGRNFSACTQLFPGKVPLDVRSVNADWKPTALCANHYAVLYSALSKSPLVVVERLSRAQISDAGDEQRTNEFYPDPRLPAGARAELADFAGSGFDRGHMSPAADQPDATSMAQSFVLSNMVAQDPTNNRKIWSKIEKDVRKFVRRAQGDVFVYSGPMFVGQPRTIGRNKVWVPTHLFKLVYDEASGRSWAYILPNTADARIEAPMDYPSFVKRTGWSLLGAAGGQHRAEGAF